MHDLLIIGGGPAGASAAVFAARAGLNTVVIDNDKGMTRRAMVHNHLGFPDGITGPDLVELGRRHAESAGATWVEGTVSDISPASDQVTVTTESGDTYEARDVLVTTGFGSKVVETAGVTVKEGSEPRIPAVVESDADGRTGVAHVWAAGTAGDVSVHTIITAGDGARVAVNIISEQRGERWVDHDLLPAPNS